MSPLWICFIMLCTYYSVNACVYYSPLHTTNDMQRLVCIVKYATPGTMFQVRLLVQGCSRTRKIQLLVTRADTLGFKMQLVSPPAISKWELWQLSLQVNDE